MKAPKAPPQQADADPALVAGMVRDARARTLRLAEDLEGDRLLGPKLDVVNPPLWEAGHLAWFQEKWVLRRRPGAPSMQEGADALYDSAAVPHATRWDLPLPSMERTRAYLEEVRDAVLERIERGLGEEDLYFVLLTVFHEDMHQEAFLSSRQTLGWPAPRAEGPEAAPSPQAPPPSGDVEVPGGRYLLGAVPGGSFVFDNEKWAHEVRIAPFALARAAVTQEEFAAFVEAGGYRRREWWTEAGWRWREEAGAEHPLHWRRDGRGDWLRRDFDRWVPLEPHRPALHVNAHEAEAYCRHAGRRLPTEAEWEATASAQCEGGLLGPGRRRFPWGDAPPGAARVHMDWRGFGCAGAGAYAEGDTPSGCRQMLGNAWEWTASPFAPYPGFRPDPYREYSQPWFSTHRVLRGGSWATRSRLVRNTWRNFYEPHRRDVFAGFRTCAVEKGS